MCTSTCGNGFFTLAAPNRCLKCHPYCSICSGPSESECTGCVSPYFYQPDSTLCRISCPIQKYYTSGSSCLNCHPFCLTCSGPQQISCLSCDQDRYLKLNECQLDCGAGFWNDQSDQICKPCSQFCADCFGPGETQCIYCITGYNLLKNQSCQPDCPSGTYRDQMSLNGDCKSCDQACSECSGPSELECLTCSQNYLLTPQNVCVSTCPKGTFQLNPTHCSECFSRCETCVRFGSRACLSCAEPMLLVKSRGSCSDPPCPDRTFLVNSKECESCTPHCKSCTGRRP